MLYRFIKIIYKKEFWICAGAMVVVIVYYAFVGSKPASDGIKLGGAFGLSGNCAEWGEGEYMAAQMAVDEINVAGGVNGKKKDFIIENTQSEKKKNLKTPLKNISS